MRNFTKIQLKALILSIGLFTSSHILASSQNPIDTIEFETPKLGHVAEITKTSNYFNGDMSVGHAFVEREGREISCRYNKEKINSEVIEINERRNGRVFSFLVTKKLSQRVGVNKSSCPKEYLLGTIKMKSSKQLRSKWNKGLKQVKGMLNKCANDNSCEREVLIKKNPLTLNIKNLRFPNGAFWSGNVVLDPIGYSLSGGNTLIGDYGVHKKAGSYLFEYSDEVSGEIVNSIDVKAVKRTALEKLDQASGLNAQIKNSSFSFLESKFPRFTTGNSLLNIKQSVTQTITPDNKCNYLVSINSGNLYEIPLFRGEPSNIAISKDLTLNYLFPYRNAEMIVLEEKNGACNKERKEFSKNKNKPFYSMVYGIDYEPRTGGIYFMGLEMENTSKISLPGSGGGQI